MPFPSDMTDEEFIESLLEFFENDDGIQAEFVEAEMNNGKLMLSGRLASDEELQAIDEILTEQYELEPGEYQNEIWVDDTLVFEGHEKDSDGVNSPLDLDSDDDLDSETGFSESDDDDD